MGSAISMVKKSYIIGKCNRNAPTLYRAYNCHDHLFPYEPSATLKDVSSVRLAIILESFNSLVSCKLDIQPTKQSLSEEEIEIYKTLIRPEKVLQRLLSHSQEARDVKLELSVDEKQVYLCRNYITELNENISHLENITVFQVCCNYLRILPYGIGKLKNLKMLILSRNRLVQLPEELGFCIELREIDVSFNSLRSLPSSLMALKKLNTLHIAGNQFKELPTFIGKLSSLKYLNLGNNPITHIPLEIFKLPFLLSLSTDNCNFSKKSKFQVVGNLSLKEISARRIIQNNISVYQSIPKSLRNYILSAQECSFCGGPFFEYFVEVEDFHSFESEIFPVRYRMCSLHYKQHSDRLQTLFEKNISTFPSKLLQDTGLSVSEIFNPFCLDDFQQKLLLENCSSSSRVPLMSLGRYNSHEHKRYTVSRLIKEDCENWNVHDKSD